MTGEAGMPSAPAWPRQADLFRHGLAWTRVWTMPVSAAVHALLLSGFLAFPQAGPRPPPLPQIELLPPAPAPPLPEEAAPSPADVKLQPKPVFAAAAAGAVAPPLLHPLLTTSARADRAIPNLPRERPRPVPAPQSLPVLPDVVKPTVRNAAAIPLSSDKSATNLIARDPSEAPRMAGPPPDYIGLIRGRLEHFKRYPAEARALGEVGTAWLRFSLARSGELRSASIAVSAGSASLDAATLQMVRRAAPFPPFPDGYESEELDLKVPVEFTLKDR